MKAQAEHVDLLDSKTSTSSSTQHRPKPRHTFLGTACARSWDDAWIASVEGAEQRLGHRICGARTMAGTPCELPSNHENGRCRFHGGFPLTGAAPGNRNAVIHGLYSRRLRTCNAQCPLWRECPCAGPDVAALPPSDRPTCPYEQTEYNTTLTDALQCATARYNDPLSLHVAHNIALLQVMMTRAALALRNAPLIDIVTATRDATEHADASEVQSSKPSAQLQAFMRIASEFRHFTLLLQPRHKEEVLLTQYLDHASHASHDTSLDPDSQEIVHPGAHVTKDEGRRTKDEGRRMMKDEHISDIKTYQV